MANSFQKSLGKWSSIPAGMIDRAYLNETRGFIQAAWVFMKTRAIYLFLFWPLSVLDLFIAGTLASWSGLAAAFSFGDDARKKYIESLNKYATLFSKNLYALAALAVGIIYPKLIVFYFTPEPTKEEGVRSGGHYYKDEEAQMVTPKSEQEIQVLIKKALKDGKKVMPVGAGFSQGKQFIPQGGNGKSSIVVDLSELNTVEINQEDHTATVGAGATWSKIQTTANDFKMALQVMQASNVFSVGGSVGTNIHGWDHKNGSLSNVILEMEVIDAQGEKRTVKPGDELFHLITGGLGLYGIVTKVKLKLTDNIKLKERGELVPIDQYVDHFRRKVLTADNHKTKMHLYRLSIDPANLLGEGIAVNYDDESNSAPVRTENLTQEAPNGSRFNRVMINLARRLDWVRRYYWNGEKARLQTNADPELTTNEVMQPPINAMFNNSVSEAEWLQEYFLPEEQLAEFLKELGHLLTENKVCLINASVRFVKQNDQSLMSYANQGDRFAVVLAFNQSLREDDVVKAKKWLRKSQSLAVNKGGTYYLPYQHVSNPEDFRKAYPHAEEAQALKEKYDPQGVFTSGFHQKYMAKKSETPNYFKIVMGNPEYREAFKGFLEVVLQRVDTEKLYTLLEDVMEYNDTHEEIYQELTRRLPQIMPGTLGTISRLLKSLSDIKHDLGEQAVVSLPEDLKEINGLVEIGYPGRFINGFKEKYKVTGNVVAVNEAESMTDFIQSGFPRPYNQFAKLDYRKPNLKDLPDNSADVITCYVGLHHFTEEGVEEFLKEVSRVLRKGGHFILVDHDVTDEKTMAMAHMAHMIFNAVNGESIKDEMTEVRRFNSMDHWRKLLMKHGLWVDLQGADVPMVRKNDPSRNRMISFVNNQIKLDLSNVVYHLPPITDRTFDFTNALNAVSSLAKLGSMNATVVQQTELPPYQGSRKEFFASHALSKIVLPRLTDTTGVDRSKDPLNQLN